jgi:hypothetical protein
MQTTIRLTLGAALALLVGAPIAAFGADAAAEPAPAPVERLPGVNSAADEPAEVLVVKRANGVEYMSGGVGDESQDALTAVDDRFNLQIEMATLGGKYLGGGSVHIEDTEGRTVLDAVSDGPIFYAKLPAGTYRIRVTADGKPLNETVTVAENGRQQLTLTWPATRAGDAPERDIP